MAPSSTDKNRPEEKGTVLDWLRDRWTRASRTERRLVYLVAICLITFLAAEAVAAWRWREDVSRSAIATAMVSIWAITALILFGSKGPKTIVAGAACIGAILAFGGTKLDLDSLFFQGPVPRGAVADCPDLPSDYVYHGVVAQTEFGVAHLRAAPTLDSGIELRYPQGCEIRFTGYCLGSPKSDWRFHLPDPVWLDVAGHSGYIAAADLKSLSTIKNSPSAGCSATAPPLERPEINAPLTMRLSGPVVIAAAAPGAVMVGFAAYYEDVAGDPGTGRWHQLGIDSNTADGVTAEWDTRSVPGQGRRQAAAVTVAVVPCLGPEFPIDRATGTAQVAERAFVVVNRPPSSGTTGAEAPPSLTGAGDAACFNPDR